MKDYLMKKGYLFSVLVHLIVFPLSCAYERNNPIDEGGPNFIPPKITIDENTSSVKDQDTIHLDSITTVGIGNREQSIFSIKLDTGELSRLAERKLHCNQPVKYGDTIQIPAVPLKTGYSFDVWYSESDYV